MTTFYYIRYWLQWSPKFGTW